LHELKEHRESLFNQKKACSDQIRGLINRIKGTQETRDTLTTSVKLTKEERAKLHDSIKAKQSEFDKRKLEYDAAVKKANLKGDPAQLKREIERLEHKIETDVVSFEKEKQLMKVIKQMKQQLAGAKTVFDLREKARIVARELSTLRDQANEKHEAVQHTAAQSQEQHAAMKDVQKQIDAHRSHEKELDTQIDAKKAEMAPLAAQADDLQKKLDTLGDQLGIERQARDVERSKKTLASLAEKRAAVEAKLKTGGKLTTQDLLIMQSGDTA
jgi:phosphoserine phosphatase